MKQTAIIMLIVGIALILFSLLFPVAIFILNHDAINSAAVNIIGGADGPTAWFLYSSAIRDTFLRFVLDAGLIAVIVSVILFIKAKRKK